MGFASAAASSSTGRDESPEGKEMDQLGIPAAFIAGLISFLSPCVLPLVPGYVSMMSGASLEELKSGSDANLTRRVWKSSLAFIGGFTVVFVVLGASATWVGQFLLGQRTVFNVVAGVLIIIFGVHLTGWVKIPLLYREARIHAQSSGRGWAGSFLIGLAFAFGWTPCIGPILAAILAVAATRETIYQGMFLLIIYSAGLGIPFLLTSLGLSRFLKFYARFRTHFGAVEVTSGILLIAIGVLIASNRLGMLSGYLSFLNRFVL
jgi:cytochrome c-type biogenesis protein